MSGEASPARCRSCGAPVRWVTMAGTQRRMPVDREPHPEGTVKITPRGTYTSGVVLSRVEIARLRRGAPDAPLHRSHFQTCPSADAHRAPRAVRDDSDGTQLGLL